MVQVTLRCLKPLLGNAELAAFTFVCRIGRSHHYRHQHHVP
jgi:hypothetical protein